jgi:hypothetical protein
LEIVRSDNLNLAIGALAFGGRERSRVAALLYEAGNSGPRAGKYIVVR